MRDKSDIGVIGLATMGRNIALNFLDHGQLVSVWNLETELSSTFSLEFHQDNLFCASTLEEFVNSIARPRRILMMIKAGDPIDQMIYKLKRFLSKGDIVIDGGNTHFNDTQRRHSELEIEGIHFVGMGVSGGESGARYGPSIMFGGSDKAWETLKDQLSIIAAKSDLGTCVTRVGPDGAGHFVKMVHNGIEYGDMQLIAESYDILNRGLKLSPEKISAIFEKWNNGALESYLIELTAIVLSKKDIITKKPMIELILDVAEQKGTGRWTVESALNLGIPIPTIAAAVDARAISSQKASRVIAAQQLRSSSEETNLSTKLDTDLIGQALLAAKLCAYAQGIQLISAGSKAFSWKINLAKSTAVWTGGCIIRAKLLKTIIEALSKTPKVDNLLLAPSLISLVKATTPALRKVNLESIALGIPIPAFSASLAWYDAISSEKLPQNLTQAQRDAFGAHMYERIDEPGKKRHTKWID